MDVTKVNVKKFTVEEYVEATVFLTEFVIKYMLIPGKVEGWVNIVEMGNWGLSELPLKSLMKISSNLQDVYKCRLANSFIINPPSSIYYIWGLFRPFLDKVTQTKIIIIKEGVSKQMLDIYEPEQLEKRFGGTSDNLITFWPPVFPNSPIEFESKDNVSDEKIRAIPKLKEKAKKWKKKDDYEKTKQKNDEKLEENYLDENIIDVDSELKEQIDNENNSELILKLGKNLEVFKDIEEEEDEKGQGEIIEDVEILLDKKEKKRIRNEKREKRRRRRKEEELQNSLSEEKMREDLVIESLIPEEAYEEKSVRVPEVQNEGSSYLCGCQSRCLIL